MRKNIKKLVISTVTATALLALPVANKADAAEIETTKNVVYYKVNLTTDSDWIKDLLKSYKGFLHNWLNQNYTNQSKQNDLPEEKQTSKESNKEKTGKENPVIEEKQQAKPESPKQEVQKPSQKPAPKPVQQKPVEEKKPVEETVTSLSQFEQQVVDLTNQERAKNGLAPLKVDETLSKVAREKSRDMSANRYFSHTSPTYGSPFDMMKQFGVSYRTAGENIAMGQRTPQEVVNAWMNSEGHRANILNSNFTHIGVGYVQNGHYWTQQFIGK